jgi:hypothetical protein
VARGCLYAPAEGGSQCLRRPPDLIHVPTLSAVRPLLKLCLDLVILRRCITAAKNDSD